MTVGFTLPFQMFWNHQWCPQHIKNHWAIVKNLFEGRWRQSKMKLGAQNEISDLCWCVGRAASAWVAQPRWVAPLANLHCWTDLRGSLCPGGSLGPQVGRVSLAGSFWRPSRCPNRACDSSLERYWSLLSKKSGIMQFGFHLPCQKPNLPTLVKMSRMRLPQGRVLLQSTFEGLPQLKIELMIAHWKGISV